MGEQTIKRNSKDSVFVKLFQDKRSATTWYGRGGSRESYIQDMKI